MQGSDARACSHVEALESVRNSFSNVNTSITADAWCEWHRCKSMYIGHPSVNVEATADARSEHSLPQNDDCRRDVTYSMFLGPPPSTASGSATEQTLNRVLVNVIY